MAVSETVALRFWAKVQKGDGCWLWTGAHDNKGYGYLRMDQPRTINAIESALASRDADLTALRKECDDALIALNGEREARHRDPIVIRNLQSDLAAARALLGRCVEVVSKFSGFDDVGYTDPMKSSPFWPTLQAILNDARDVLAAVRAAQPSSHT